MGPILLWHLVDNPFPTFVGFLAVLAVVVILLSRATWRPAAPLRLARRRTWGQAITSAGRMYVTRWRLFLSIGVLFLPISLLITLLQAGVLGASSIAGIEDEGQAAGAFALIVVAIGTALTVLGITLVQAATAHALREIDEGRQIGPLGAYRMAAVHTTGLLGAIVIAVVAVTLLGSSHLPVACRNLAGGALGADCAGGSARGAGDGVCARAKLPAGAGQMAEGGVAHDRERRGGRDRGTAHRDRPDTRHQPAVVAAEYRRRGRLHGDDAVRGAHDRYAYFDARVADELRPATAPGDLPPEIELSTG